MATQPSDLELVLLEEVKIAELLDDPHFGKTQHGEAPQQRLEASGVVAKDGLCYVIFDNTPDVAELAGLSGSGATRLIHAAPGASRGIGYEDIAYDRLADRFYILIEALPHGRGFMAEVEEYDGSFRHLASARLDFLLGRANKGLEGLTSLRRADRMYLLGLCEGNRCQGGAAGRRPGGGRIQLFERGRRHWDHAGTIRLPQTLWFEDYSSLSIAGDRLVVVSQASSAMWVGTLAPSSWDVVGDGTVYRFPADGDGKTVYCNVEGVSWVSDDQVVVVSDRAKTSAQSKRCRAKDESIHVFAIPEPSA
jgi:hypothetical protein